MFGERGFKKEIDMKKVCIVKNQKIWIILYFIFVRHEIKNYIKFIELQSFWYLFNSSFCWYVVYLSVFLQ